MRASLIRLLARSVRASCRQGRRGASNTTIKDIRSYRERCTQNG